MSSRKRRNHNVAPSAMRIERLEQRLPLAGNVTAELAGSTLRLTGDNLANDVMVASAAGGTIAVIGISTTVNGQQAAFVTTKAVTSIVAKFNGGDDAVGFGNSAADYAEQRQFTLQATALEFWSGEGNAPPVPFDIAAVQAKINEVAGGITTFSIPGSLTVTTGHGNDSVGISGNLGGSVNVNLGSAELGNGIVIGSKVSASRVDGGVTVTGGDAYDLFAIANVSVAGTVSAALGNGTNWMVAGGQVDTPATFGALAYTGGTAYDFVDLTGELTVRNNVRIFTGVRGSDRVSFGQSEFGPSDGGGTGKVLGNVVVNTGTGNDGDTVLLVGDFRGDVSVTTGGGQDTVSVASVLAWGSTDGSDPDPTFGTSIASTIGRDLTIKAGAGKDQITIGTATVGRNVSIDAGSGKDFVRIGGLQVSRRLDVNLGAGNDSLSITNLRAFAAGLFGGSGTNSLSTDATTRTGSRTLRHHQFQAVTNR